MRPWLIGVLVCGVALGVARDESRAGGWLEDRMKVAAEWGDRRMQAAAGGINDVNEALKQIDPTTHRLPGVSIGVPVPLPSFGYHPPPSAGYPPPSAGGYAPHPYPGGAPSQGVTYQQMQQLADRQYQHQVEMATLQENLRRQDEQRQYQYQVQLMQQQQWQRQVAQQQQDAALVQGIFNTVGAVIQGAERPRYSYSYGH